MLHAPAGVARLVGPDRARATSAPSGRGTGAGWPPGTSGPAAAGGRAGRSRWAGISPLSAFHGLKNGAGEPPTNSSSCTIVSSSRYAMTTIGTKRKSTHFQVQFRRRAIRSSALVASVASYMLGHGITLWTITSMTPRNASRATIGQDQRQHDAVVGVVQGDVQRRRGEQRDDRRHPGQPPPRTRQLEVVRAGSRPLALDGPLLDVRHRIRSVQGVMRRSAASRGFLRQSFNSPSHREQWRHAPV